VTRLLEIGRVVKPHGVRGEVVVELVTDRTERLAAGSTLDSAHGELVVRHSQPHGHRFIVSFVAVDDRESAEALRDVVLLAAELDDPDALWVHHLIGADVVLPDGTPVGRVDAVEASAADDLLVLDSGALVPAGFATGWDETHRLVIDPPAGLLPLD
jgi:16S rRNA processing protein RimM